MKKLISILILFYYCFAGFAIAQNEFTTLDSVRLVRKIDKQMISLRQELDKKYGEDQHKELMIEFAIDTARIERFTSEKMSVDYSTAGMNDAITELNNGYDKLLNKYYKKLISGLEPTDKEILKQAQRNWILYRDSQIKLIRLLSDDKYSGGGSIQTNICSADILSLTKERVIQLFQYIVWE
jgi:uncharacterized protein YecT (DUF1311 family)